MTSVVTDSEMLTVDDAKRLEKHEKKGGGGGGGGELY